MPAGNLSDAERVKRLYQLKTLRDEGKTDYEIANECGMSHMAVKRGFKYLEELEKVDITLEVAAEKRTELWISLSDIESELNEVLTSYLSSIICPVCDGKGKKEVHKYFGKGDNRTEEVYDVGCDNCKGLGFVRDIFALNKVIERLMDITDRKMKLYGLDINQPTVNVNQQFNYGQAIDKIPSGVREQIAKKLIASHEDKKRSEYESVSR